MLPVSIIPGFGPIFIAQVCVLYGYRDVSCTLTQAQRKATFCHFGGDHCPVVPLDPPMNAVGAMNWGLMLYAYDVLPFEFLTLFLL
jgi:hypothetical protein